MLRRLAIVALLLLATFAPGCRLFNRKAKIVPPPPPAPPPVETSTPKPPAAQQPTVPPPPQIPPEQPNLAGQPAPEAPVVKLPPPPKRHGRRSQQPQQQSQETPPVQPGETPPASPAVPELEQILSPQQRQAYNEAIDANIGRAQRTLDAVQSRRLNPDQKTTQERIRAFVQQANEARRTDLFRAKNLAERAAVLADDLLRTLQ